MGNIIGFVAAFCTTVAFVPQAIKVYKTKKTDDISFGMFLLMCVGVALWDVYGFIIANSITLLQTVYIFIMKIKLEREKLIPNSSLITSTEFIPSASALKFVMILCLRTGTIADFTSSMFGVNLP